MVHDTHKHPSELHLSCLWSVVDREKSDMVATLLEGQKSFFNLVQLGHGTANSQLLNWLGLGQTEKALFFSIMPNDIACALMETLDAALALSRPGHGIAFITRIFQGCYHTPVQFAGAQTEEPPMDNSGETAMHDLIMVVLNRGYTEEVMDEARKAGATGGTVLHARGTGLSGAEKFFGVTIQPEKEVLMIVANTDDSCAIMGAIADKVGPGSDANAISFSMPVSGVRGLAHQAMKPENGQ